MWQYVQEGCGEVRHSPRRNNISCVECESRSSHVRTCDLHTMKKKKKLDASRNRTDQHPFLCNVGDQIFLEILENLAVSEICRRRPRSSHNT